MTFDEYYMNMLDSVKAKSKDRSTQVGCILVGKNNSIISTGYNGFPVGVDDNVEYRHERPAKYLYTSHSEQNAISYAARNGVSTEGATAYVSLFPCADCCRMLIQAGIKRIVTYKITTKHDHWSDSFKASRMMMYESGIELCLV